MAVEPRRVISAAEALRLPSAAVSASDAEAAASYLADIEAYIRANMRRVGCTMPIDPTRVNPVIAAEIERRLRAAGWRAEFQKTQVPSVLAPGKMVISYQLALAPVDEAYAEADRAAKTAHEEVDAGCVSPPYIRFSSGV